MNKSELTAHARSFHGGNANSVNATIDSITDILRSGETISLVGFGTFSVVATAARTGKNPRTGETVKIAASRKVKFKPSKGILG